MSLAALWAYEGLWLKVIARNPHELDIVRSAVGNIGLPALPSMIAIGIAETALAIGIVSGIWARPVAWFQLIVLFVMQSIGSIFGGIKNPVDLWVHSLPTYAGIILLISCAQGRNERKQT